MKVNLELRSPIGSSFRVARVLGLFDIQKTAEQTVTVTADIPIEDKEWQIGAIVGGSGSGKSTIARALWPDATHTSGDHDWAADCLLDDFPTELTPDQVIGLLTSVGFSSAPAWLRPYRALSTGQKMRADLARSLSVGITQPSSQSANHNDPIVFDEFTSTVDRTVAKAVSVAVAKHVRRGQSQFIAVSCHKDFLPWIEPDWVYDTDSGEFTWGSNQRPSIRLEVREGSRQAWRLFREHHYLSHDLANSSRVFLGYVTLDEGEERLAAFMGLMPVAGHKGWWRSHRTVVLPDMQGLGIGNKFQEAIAEKLWVAERKRFRITTSAPGMVHYMRKRPEIWRMSMAPKMKPVAGKTSGLRKHKKNGNIEAPKTSAGRLTATFVYLPTALRKLPVSRDQ